MDLICFRKLKVRKLKNSYKDLHTLFSAKCRKNVQENSNKLCIKVNDAERTTILIQQQQQEVYYSVRQCQNKEISTTKIGRSQ